MLIILSQLQHPHMAHVLVGGDTDTDTPDVQNEEEVLEDRERIDWVLGATLIFVGMDILGYESIGHMVSKYAQDSNI